MKKISSGQIEKTYLLVILLKERINGQERKELDLQ